MRWVERIQVSGTFWTQSLNQFSFRPFSDSKLWRTSTQLGPDFPRSLSFTYEQPNCSFSTQTRSQQPRTLRSGEGVAQQAEAGRNILSPAVVLLCSHIGSSRLSVDFIPGNWPEKLEHFRSLIKPLWRMSGDYPDFSACLKADMSQMCECY